MARSGKIEKRIIKPDALYNSRLVSRFINRMMVDGKKSTAIGLFYGAFKKIETETGKNPLSVFEQALANVSPKMEVRPRRIGGASYQIPVEVRGERREALAIRWLIESARARSNKEYRSFSAKLAVEFLEAAENKGMAVSKRESVQRAAEANRAFAHFRW